MGRAAVTLDAADRRRRDEAILDARAAGATVTDLAAEHGVCQSRVHAILRAARAAGDGRGEFNALAQAAAAEARDHATRNFYRATGRVQFIYGSRATGTFSFDILEPEFDDA